MILYIYNVTLLKPYITLSEHFPCKYGNGDFLWIENKLKINEKSKELSISAYVKLKTLKAWKSFKIEHGDIIPWTEKALK